MGGLAFILCGLIASLFHEALAGSGSNIVGQAASQEVSLAESVSEELLLRECSVDEDGFVGADWALVLSATDHKKRSQVWKDLETALAAQGLLNINVAGDGSCQFHAICVAGTLEIDAGELAGGSIFGDK
ncbi:unnamed protein product [Polarella glacialis]|uniref:Ubiquitinyl hydrolase 1 n=1 Tax=Polarella glacialis TaxID=89957 RepID=A0A813I4Z2_POLGL|nr:unnamed protein product [Polarella glacialis]